MIKDNCLLIDKSTSNSVLQKHKETLNQFLNDKIVIPKLDYIHILDIKDILYIKASSNYSIIYDTAGNSVLSSKTLKHFERNLINKGFIRVHYSTLINVKKIKGIIKSISSF